MPAFAGVRHRKGGPRAALFALLQPPSGVSIYRKPCCKPPPGLVWVALRGLAQMVPGRRLHGRAWWSPGLICLVSFFVVGMPPSRQMREIRSRFGPTMRFVVVRSNAPGCEPTCPEWISARLDRSRNAGAAQAHAQNARRSNCRRRDSPGGNVDAALTLGRLIRKNKLDIAVGKTRFVGCQPEVEELQGKDGKGARYFGDAYASGAICNSCLSVDVCRRHPARGRAMGLSRRPSDHHHLHPDELAVPDHLPRRERQEEDPQHKRSSAARTPAATRPTR